MSEKRTKPVKGDSWYTRKWTSRTGPESGHLNKLGKPKGPHYLSHQTVDRERGIILDTTVTSREVNDAVPYSKQLEYVHGRENPRKWTGRSQDQSLIHAQLAAYFADRMPDRTGWNLDTRHYCR